MNAISLCSNTYSVCMWRRDITCRHRCESFLSQISPNKVRIPKCPQFTIFAAVCLEIHSLHAVINIKLIAPKPSRYATTSITHVPTNLFPYGMVKVK